MSSRAKSRALPLFPWGSGARDAVRGISCFLRSCCVASRLFLLLSYASFADINATHPAPVDFFLPLTLSSNRKNSATTISGCSCCIKCPAFATTK